MARVLNGNARRVRASSLDDAPGVPPTRVINEQGVPHNPRMRLKKPVERGMRLGTWNVGSLTGKGRELADCMRRRRVDGLCVQETRWKGNGVRELGDGYKLWYSGDRTGQAGVGVILDEKMKEKVLEVNRISARLLGIKVLMDKEVLTIISAYAPQVGCSEEDKEEFWESFERCLTRLPETEKVVVGGDLNGHVGAQQEGYEREHGGFGFGNRNDEGERILEAMQSLELYCVNTTFKKREEQLVTYCSGEEEPR